MSHKNLINVTGRKFGRLTVVRQAPNQGNSTSGAWWYCRCECGEQRAVRSYDLRNRLQISCGCLQRERTSAANKTHGRSDTAEYRMWKGARQRAKAKGLPCTIGQEDIPAIPATCPVLGIPIVDGRGSRRTNNSASLDRIVPKKGYVPGNIRIISHRANLLKSNASAEELALVLADAQRIEGER